ncbi:hypothetical protein D083_1826 [Dickeya solani RNS 08.23.3.1.A]|nr:hypothetical protein D083_1826 [Dickeya solani RNS 08.23.3.1.A]
MKYNSIPPEILVLKMEKLHVSVSFSFNAWDINGVALSIGFRT